MRGVIAAGESDFAGLQLHPGRMSLRCFRHDCLYDKHRSAATRPPFT